MRLMSTAAISVLHMKETEGVGEVVAVAGGVIAVREEKYRFLSEERRTSFNMHLCAEQVPPCVGVPAAAAVAAVALVADAMVTAAMVVVVVAVAVTILIAERRVAIKAAINAANPAPLSCPQALSP